MYICQSVPPTCWHEGSIANPRNTITLIQRKSLIQTQVSVIVRKWRMRILSKGNITHLHIVLYTFYTLVYVYGLSSTIFFTLSK